MDDLIRTSTLMVQAAEELHVPILVTEQSPKKLLETSTALRKALPEHTPVFEKTSFTMITPEVSDQLNDMEQLKSVVLLGIEAHICVFQTALDLLELGYDVHIVTDACSSQRDMDRLVAFEVRASARFLPCRPPRLADVGAGLVFPCVAVCADLPRVLSAHTHLQTNALTYARTHTHTHTHTH